MIGNLGSQSATTLAVDWPDITDESGLTLSVSGSGPVSEFQQLTASDVLAAFNDVVGSLQTMQASGLLSNPLPLLNEGLSSLVQTASSLTQDLAQTTVTPQELLSTVVSALEQAPVPRLPCLSIPRTARP